MTCTVADKIPEMFAAVAPIGGQDVPLGVDKNFFNNSVKLAYFGMAGDHDYF